MIDAILIIVGLAVIVFSAHVLVDGASSLAKRLGISDLVIGLTIVAFGTSAPELTVNVFSALKGSTDIAVGNIFGSNICNILLILGVAALIRQLSVKQTTRWKEIPFTLLAAIVLAVLGNDMLLDGAAHNILSRGDGLILLGFFCIFIVYTFGITSKDDPDITPHKEKSLWMSLLMIGLGIAGLFGGGKILIQSAVTLATTIGMSQKVIGLTIVAIGTSLPELATTAVAAYKKKSDIAVGNVVGSNIFNTFFVLGITPLIMPVPFDATVNADIIMSVFSSVILFMIIPLLRSRKNARFVGISFILLYIGYITFTVIR